MTPPMTGGWDEHITALSCLRWDNPQRRVLHWLPEFPKWEQVAWAAAVPSFEVSGPCSPAGVFLYLPKDLSCVLISVFVKIQTEAIDLWHCPPRSPARTSSGPREQGGDPRLWAGLASLSAQPAGPAFLGLSA